MSLRQRIQVVLDRFVLGGTYTIKDYESAMADIAEALDDQ